MARLEISLFGRFDVQYDHQSLPGLEAIRAQELLGYILTHRTRPHPREYLADLLWHERATVQAKKYLRKVLWQLQAAFAPLTEDSGIPLIQIDGDWIHYNPQADCWLDIAEFENTFAEYEGMPGAMMESQDIDALQRAVNLYTGDLLEGWYQDWSLCERERFQYIHLAMLDKLADYYEAHQECELGIRYATQILQHEPAHERGHRRMMRLHFIHGNRAAALRQYDHCVAALAEELDVAPSQRTTQLYEQIRQGQRPQSFQDMTTEPSLRELHRRLKQIEATLGRARGQVTQELQALESMLQKRCERRPRNGARDAPTVHSHQRAQ